MAILLPLSRGLSPLGIGRALAAQISTPDQTYRDLVMAGAPSGYWRFAETSGVTAVDEIGTRNGTYGGTYTLNQPGAISGDANSSVLLSGAASSFITLPSPFTGLTAYTVEVWFKTTYTGRQVLMGTVNSGSFAFGDFTLRGAGTIRFEMNNGTLDGYISASYADGNWHHIALVWSGGNSFQVYFDGVSKTVTYTAMGTPVWSAGALGIGGTTGVGLPFNGSLDECAFYPTALTSIAILNRYHAGVNSYRSQILLDGPVAYWRLGETSGTIAADETGNFAGTYAGTYTLGNSGAISGDTNKAAGFSAGYVTTNAQNIVTNAGDPWTFESWFRPTLANSGNIVGSAKSSTDRMAISHFGGRIFCSCVGNASTVNTIAVNVWHHLALVAPGAGAAMQLYVDGVLQTGTGNSSLNGTVRLAIGARNDLGSFWAGDLDEVAIYGTALSSARILAHFNKGAGA